MAERDERAGGLGRRDTGNLGHSEDVALRQGGGAQQPDGRGGTREPALGDGEADGVGLRAHVHHLGVTLGVEVAESRRRFGEFFRHGTREGELGFMTYE